MFTNRNTRDSEKSDETDTKAAAGLLTAQTIRFHLGHV
jgi:hypothetical protein